MRNYVCKIAAALLSLTLCGIGMGYPAAALTEQQSTQVYFCDEGDWLSETEFAEVLEMLEDTADEIDMNLGVWLGSEPMGQSATVSFCDDTYDELYGINTDGVFLYLDLSGESSLYDYISTSGKGQFYYTNSEEYDRISDIFSDMNPYLSRGEEDVVSAISEFCFDLEYYAERGAPSDTYYTYNSDTGKYLIMEDDEVQEVKELPTDYTAAASWSTIIVVSLMLGLVIGAITMFSICRSYRFKRPGNTNHYQESGKVRFTVRQDQFLRQYRTRTRISSDSSSSGGGGGGSSHSSSSGGSHGGGGNSR